MDLGFFTINSDAVLTALNAFLAQGSLIIFLQLVALFGWLILVKPLLGLLYHFYTELTEEHYMHDWESVVLAIDIPALNVQTPKAVEQMFAHLAGAYAKPSLKELLTTGYKQRWFSMEVVSIEGYIQFVVWTEKAFRDLIEASIYAQYPDCEITEIEDYTKTVPEKLPNETYDIWISDFGLAEHSAYPIRLYSEFEHSISKDTVLKDPMGTFLESFSRLGPKEQMWFQIMIEPVGNEWKEEAIAKVKEILGIADAHEVKDNIVDKMTRGLMKMLVMIGDQVFNREPHTDEEEEDKHPEPVKITPGTGKVVESMENKMNKIAFKVKMRGAYIAPKTVFNPRRGVNALVGAINQYNIPSANSIVKTEAPKGKKKEKPEKLFEAYKKRAMNTKSTMSIMNVEELATIWHFPMSHVKTPLVTKAMTKQAEPPVGLPVEFIGSVGAPVDGVTSSPDEKPKKTYTTDSGEVIPHDDWYENL